MSNVAASGAELVDVAVLRCWMDEHSLGEGELSDLKQLGGGSQNRLIGFRRGSDEYVLRMPPRHPRPTSNSALRREATAVAALAGTDVPVPTVLATCFDENVMGGAVFYLMQRVDGINPTVELSALHRENPTVRREMGLAAVTVLARLAMLDQGSLGLGDLGSPDDFVSRQVERWNAELESYRALSGYPGPDLPGLDRVASWLARHQPDGCKPGIMHGDFHLANLMFRRDSAEVAAVVDWEMVTVGDPLLDLGWLLATWPDTLNTSMMGEIGAAGALPTRVDLVKRYEQVCGLTLPDMTWHATLACFKLGILLEGTFARACAGKASLELGKYMRSIAKLLFARAELFMTSGIEI